MRKVFVELCKQEINKNLNSFVLLGDIGVGGFIDSKGDLLDRVINMGIAEQAMVSFAAGLSTLGGNVIVHTISPFLVERALEQIKLCCGYNENKLLLVSANGPYDYEKLGPTHHCPADVNILSTIPNLEIRLPGTEDDLRESFAEAIHSKRSFYIRLTSRGAKLPVNHVRNKDWKKIIIENGCLTEVQNVNIKNALVCIGESLAYTISKIDSNLTAAIFWTSNPFSALPSELNDYESIVLFEPYLFSCFSVTEGLEVRKIKRKLFKSNYKKIILENLGWEDFND